ncbi:MAG: MFS transporter [Acidimicrobiales bacterium]
MQAASKAAGDSNWRSHDVWAISLSAFFADLGYQSVLAGLPLFMVLDLHASVALYGLAMALGFGGGSLIAYLGSRLGDRIGHRKMAIIGNSAIPLLSLSALIASPVAAIVFFCAGWWARNLRTPSRRVMLARSTTEQHRTRAFGFLHSLDVAGGILAGAYMLTSLAAGLPYRYVFLGTAIPLAISTLCLTITSTQLAGKQDITKKEAHSTSQVSLPRNATVAILAATVLFGFSSYSIGFPVLTAAKGSHDVTLGLFAFLVFNAVSSATGMTLVKYVGSTWHVRFRNLGLLGYIPAAAGATLLGVSAALKLPYIVMLLAIAILGVSLGIVETLEPSIMSVIRPEGGSGFGLLSAYRSGGLFVGNLVMGLLYTLGAAWSYGYAAIVALIGALILLFAASTVKQRS